MREDFWFDSCGAGRIHVCRWMPEGEPKAVFQIVHGIAEVAERYDAFAQVLAQHKIPIFAISTYNTDYILLKQAHYPRALAALTDAGYTIEA